jgi:hypothetical protein
MSRAPSLERCLGLAWDRACRNRFDSLTRLAGGLVCDGPRGSGAALGPADAAAQAVDHDWPSRDLGADHDPELASG